MAIEVTGRFCLVTGSAGFIGFHTAKRLLDSGLKVVGIDNLNDYYAPLVKHKRNQILKQDPNFHDEPADIADFKRLEEIFEKYKPYRVINLAAQVGVRYSFVNPFVYEKSNLLGFLNVIELCKKHQVERLVYASSSSVYGGNKKLPFSESDPVDNPISLYAATKKANELIAHNYSHNFGLKTVGLRLFTVYGEWGRPDMAVWLFTKSIAEEKPIKLFNNGEMRRDFTFIDDALFGIIAAFESDTLPLNSIFNIGNNNAEELTKLVSLIEENLEKKAIIEYLPMQEGDLKETLADISHAKKHLGFEPKTSLEEGIKRFTNWYRYFCSQT